VGHNGEPSKLDCFLEDVQLKWSPSAGGFVFASQVVLSITTGILRLLYVISLEFAAVAVVGFLVRLAFRGLVRWYRDAAAKTNEYWAARNPDTSCQGLVADDEHSGKRQSQFCTGVDRL